MEFLFVQLFGRNGNATNLLAEGRVGHGDPPGEALLFPVRFTMHYPRVCCVLYKHYMYSPGLTLPVVGETGGDGEEVVPQAGESGGDGVKVMPVPSAVKECKSVAVVGV